MIVLKGVSVHNLRHIDLKIPHQQLTVLTGVSGSGKSSIAFDTIHAEAQRKYFDALPISYRRILVTLHKPKADAIEGLSPTIALAQKTMGNNPRSTVGTLSGILPFLRLLYGNFAIPHCPYTNKPLIKHSLQDIMHYVHALEEGSTCLIVAPYQIAQKRNIQHDLLEKGYRRTYINGKIGNIEDLPPPVLEDLDILPILCLRIKWYKEEAERVYESIQNALHIGSGRLEIFSTTQDQTSHSTFSQELQSPSTGEIFPPLEPQLFSFNHPKGMCVTCGGLGETLDYNLETILSPNKSIAEDCCSLSSSYKTIFFKNICDNLATIYHFNVHTPWKDLPPPIQKIFLEGCGSTWHKMTFVHPKTKATWVEHLQWHGVLSEARKKYHTAKNDSYRKKQASLMTLSTCPHCHGARLNPYPLAARFHGKTIAEILSSPIEDCLSFFQNIPISQEEGPSLGKLCSEIIDRVYFLKNVGLGYLSPDRRAQTLSGGETQRVRLAAYLGSNLANATYILDEPSIGLHPQDNYNLIQAIRSLCHKGNTVIVVEHDRDMMLAAEYIVEVGPGAGSLGGQIIHAGSLESLLNNPQSLTGAYLQGKKRVCFKKSSPKNASQPPTLTIRGCNANNLKDQTLSIPLQKFTALTGVSGSGKSTILKKELYPTLQKVLRGSAKPEESSRVSGWKKLGHVLVIDQTPLGKSPLSTPATYTKIFDTMRVLFANLPLSQDWGLKASHFSFNTKEGCCPKCEGSGIEKIDLDLTQDMHIPCSLCLGKRFDEKVLSVRWEGLTIYDVLQLSIEDAAKTFSHVSPINTTLKILCEFGLGYIQLGQSATTLSGGEAQRLKLAKELTHPPKEHILYILDEPTLGLHFHDINKLTALLHKLVEQGHTVITIEHNMDLVQTADWVVDMGPQGGNAGGTIMHVGPPEEIAQQNTPTGRALAATLSPPQIILPHQRDTEITTQKHLSIIHATTHNLKNLSLDIPHHKITLCAGPSGSGKSSFAFDTIYAAGHNMYCDSLGSLAKHFLKELPPPAVEAIKGIPTPIAIEKKPFRTTPNSTVGTVTEIYDSLCVLYSSLGQAFCPDTALPIQQVTQSSILESVFQLAPQEPVLITASLQIHREQSSNKKNAGQLTLKEQEHLLQRGFVRILIDGTEHLLEETIVWPKNAQGCELVVDRCKVVEKNRTRLKNSIETAIQMGRGSLCVYSPKPHTYTLGFSVAETGKQYPPLTPALFAFNTERGRCPHCLGSGILSEKNLSPTLAPTILKPHKNPSPCPSCHGAKINNLARNVVIEGMAIHQMAQITLQELLSLLKKLSTSITKQPIKDMLSQVLTKGHFLVELGLGHLSLERNVFTLSDGEAQRINLAKQISCTLTGSLYILDEISSGLHPFNLSAVYKTLTKLCKQQNTLLLTDHHRYTFHIVDDILEFGPKSGNSGGAIVSRGTYKDLQENPNSLSGKYLSFQKKICATHLRKKTAHHLVCKKVSLRNIKNLSLKIPLESLVCITGVSGAGKSTFLRDFLYASTKPFSQKQPLPEKYYYQGAEICGLAAYEKVLFFSPSTSMHLSRSDVNTYAQISGPLRQFFATLPEAKMFGLPAGAFSNNHKLGMCPPCRGSGRIHLTIEFLPNASFPCEACQGTGFAPLPLKVRTKKGENISDILSMTVDQAAARFISFPKIYKPLSALQKIGLGYLRLHQDSATLSAGELQQIALSKTLGQNQKTLYLLDEPARGLHFSDIDRLLHILSNLIDKGHSIILVTHDIDLIYQADYVLDLGPGGGKDGGAVVAQGSVADIMQNKNSLTGQFLRHHHTSLQACPNPPSVPESISS